MNKCLDTTQQRKVLEIIYREKKQRILILRQDSIIEACSAELGECDEQLFISEQKLELLKGANKDLASNVTDEIKKGQGLQTENDRLKDKARRNRKWKWIFGGVGFALGALLSLL